MVKGRVSSRLMDVLKYNIRVYIPALVLVVLFLTAGLTVCAADEAQIFDNAGLLTGEQIQMLEEKTDALRQQYNMNFIVLTTDNAQGMSAEDYADDFYRDYGFYEDGKNGGAVFLVDMENRKIYISTAEDMIRFLTNKRVEDILNKPSEYIKEQDYYNCINSMIDGTQSYLEKGIQDGQYNYDPVTKKISRYLSISSMDWLIAIGGAVLLGGIACVITIGKYQLKWGTYSYPYKEKGRLFLNVEEDRFTNEIVTQRMIPRNDDNDGGSSGGGMSTTHTSSGGGTFGGGGRDF